MNTVSPAVFASAYFAVLVLPGPGVTALVARMLARGTQGVAAFIAGFVAGALLWFAIAATGLAALAATFAIVLLAIRYLCAAYPLYLAWKFWILHLGCGTGYYTAIMAGLAGPQGKITAIEIDAGLAQRARSVPHRQTAATERGAPFLGQ